MRYLKTFHNTTNQLHQPLITLSLQIMVSSPDVWNKYWNDNSVILLQEDGETLFKEIINKTGVDITNTAKICLKRKAHEKMMETKPLFLEKVFFS